MSTLRYHLLLLSIQTVGLGSWPWFLQSLIKEYHFYIRVVWGKGDLGSEILRKVQITRTALRVNGTLHSSAMSWEKSHAWQFCEINKLGSRNGHWSNSKVSLFCPWHSRPHQGPRTTADSTHAHSEGLPGFVCSLQLIKITLVGANFRDCLFSTTLITEAAYSGGRYKGFVTETWI